MKKFDRKDFVNINISGHVEGRNLLFSIIGVVMIGSLFFLTSCGLTGETKSSRIFSNAKIASQAADAVATADDKLVVEKHLEKADKNVLDLKKNILNAPGIIQRKSFSVLKGGIEGCFKSKTISLISSSMFVTRVGGVANAGLSGGKVGFLLPKPSIQAGMDILDVEKESLGGGSTTVRTTIKSDGITATYLRSLATVANVVAHNCELDDPYCACSTASDAKSLIDRCLPQLDPSGPDYSDTVNAMASECASGPPGQRRAIAALISSYAFAQGR